MKTNCGFPSFSLVVFALLFSSVGHAAEWKPTLEIHNLEPIFGDKGCESTLETGRPSLDIIPIDAQMDHEKIKIVVQAISRKCEFSEGSFPFVERMFLSVVKAWSKAAQPVELAFSKAYFSLSTGNGVERGIVPVETNAAVQDLSFEIPVKDISQLGSILPFSLNLKAERMVGKIGDVALSANNISVAAKGFKVIVDEESFELSLDMSEE